MGCTRQSKSTMRILKQCSFKLIGNEISSKYRLLSNIKLDCSMMVRELLAIIAPNDWMEFLEFARLHIARKANAKRHKLELKLKSLRRQQFQVSDSQLPLSVASIAAQCSTQHIIPDNSRHIINLSSF
ncbi:hypothetical protein GJ496_009195 [Pomphorhynchus laevis]|nr:hypothetical protein GJ496_009195 [Pomphorhynchus laevis]